ncbi:threonine dehydratase [Roseovarius sp. TM1035]|jgi:threonine dehydratase|uniref:L-threonine dehydratase catabolic TdcB n=1 Tax=Roseovarius mucosus TaxID=215743 RepID=A0A1V0RPW9_9RHOB|nr:MULTISPECIES: hydroxyectoine utilization dehydratase EutB [Roseovarius]ARE83685.1 L-threonine dehydratase catabolic TdcB [Roseovarius mucosus]AWZ19684.1 Threonine dehydratase, catabolic [Roseovarius sp. AK1035]EDM30162.1 threonine dehydratase [Roseovarius sp. TM1035]MBW4973233.1 hydroxyectoine utilization dehydratase EutB [Roseovarius mucosus]
MRPVLADVYAAAQVISGVADRTPLVPSPYMSAVTGDDFLLKLENMQPIGAFKLRGALNAVAGAQDAAGVTCCSTGNHGRGVAYAARARGLRAVICMSDLVPQAKVEGIRALGAEVRIIGRSQDAAQTEVERLVAEDGLTEISPFDDPLVIAGQGTIGLEIMAARPDTQTLLVPLSGGGLAAGVALAAKTIKPSLRVIGISMDRGAAMYESIRAGHPVEVEEVPSLADSLGGGVGMQNRLSYAMCRDLLDDVILVTEEEIYHAMQVLYYEDRIVAEGACVVGLAAVLSGKLAPQGPTATIITGRNLDMALFTKVMTGQTVILGDKVIEGRKYGT